jgi:hypothetical protein
MAPENEEVVNSVEGEIKKDRASLSNSSAGQDSLPAEASAASLALQNAQKATIVQSDSTKQMNQLLIWKTKMRQKENRQIVKLVRKVQVHPGSSLNEADDEDRVEIMYRQNQRRLNRSLDRRRQNASVRLTQSQAYFELIEDRIEDMEKKLRALRREATPPPVKPLTDFPPTNVGIKYMTWAELSTHPKLDTYDPKTWRHRPEIDPDPKHIIEVLNEAPYTDSANMAKNERSSEAPGNTTFNLKTTGSAAVKQSHMIRIRSRLLLKVIEDATKRPTVFGLHGHRLLLLRPYKLLVTYAGDLRKFFERLEQKITENAGNGA